MDIRFTNSPSEAAKFDTAALRRNFLIEKIFDVDQIVWTYSHYDRVMIGGACPVNNIITLDTHPNLRSEYFLERREIGIINVGGTGKITVGSQEFTVKKMDCVYVGKGTREVSFASTISADPARFYLLSSPAHQAYPTRSYTKEDALPLTVGSTETSNQRTIYKYIHTDGIQSCQLVMGLTSIHVGSVWNTMPAHVHDRRMEAYFYFDVPDNQQVLHLMGEPQETRPIWTKNHQALISPPWSVHAGCGTSNYSFIWGMAGENKDYTDMDPIAVSDLR